MHVIKYSVTCIGIGGGRKREKPSERYRCIRTLLVRIRIRPAATRSVGYTDVSGDAGYAGGLPGLPSLDPLIWHDPDRNSPRVLVLVLFFKPKEAHRIYALSKVTIVI